MSRSFLAVSLLFALALSPALRAAPLDKEGCNRLKGEQALLEQAGARGFMSNGPQWAKSHLEPAKLEQIRRLLEIDEQLLFRCHGKPLVNLPKDPDPDPAAREPDSPDGAKEPVPKAKAAKVPKAKKDAVKKAPEKKEPAKKPVLKKAAAPAGGAGSPVKLEAAPAPAPKSDTAKKAAAAKKAKPKGDDSARAPASDPGASPFRPQDAATQ